MNIVRIIVYVLLATMALPCFSNDRFIGTLEELIAQNKKQNMSHYDMELKLIDFDLDGDLDVAVTILCGESNCVSLYVNVNGLYHEKFSQFGYLTSYNDYKSDLNTKQIRVTSHCCGESPFDSYTTIGFENDSHYLISDYVLYDARDYYQGDLSNVQFSPTEFLSESYQVEVTFDQYNARFSSDLRSHTAYFTCEEDKNTNIVAKIKSGAIIDVIAEYKGDDREERTWLYVEIPQQAMYDSYECSNPIYSDFENKKLRAWVSDRNVKKI
ncbi:hypothetical protein [Reinekea thalattae]|uniref:Uncharacterized protein n=1 Tax=Reinekea thalattae TaxID=2593301 RepID=A0A5C8Z8W7_9GAMM|nr:hypothetical protein [Reinekea thalattae]TXR53718.1 hypothetical protein FME95_03930 [Reinekea thalattae]